MQKKWIWLGLGSGFLLAFLILGVFVFLHTGATAAVEVKTYVGTLYGLNHDMRKTLQKIREGQDVNGNVGILHDQLHLVKDTLHLVKKGNDVDPHFVKLHGLNHDMRVAWHEVKKERDREQNLQLLDDQLHEMKETLDVIKGEPVHQSPLSGSSGEGMPERGATSGSQETPPGALRGGKLGSGLPSRAGGQGPGGRLSRGGRADEIACDEARHLSLVVRLLYPEEVERDVQANLGAMIEADRGAGAAVGCDRQAGRDGARGGAV